MTPSDDKLATARRLFLDAVSHQENRDYPQAEKLLRDALALVPERESILSNLSSVLLAQERFDDAEEVSLKLLRLNRDNSQGWFNLGVSKSAKGLHEEAVQDFDIATTLQHDPAATGAARGRSLLALQRFEEAAHSYHQALAANPDDTATLNGLGSLMARLSKVQEALTYYDRAIALSPREAETYVNKGNVLMDMNRVDEAIASFNKALALKPDFAKARWGLALASLAKEDFDTGWKNFEARWDDLSICGGVSFLDSPWLGMQDIRGKRLLLHSEQGFGDTLQFSRFVEKVAALGAHVTLRVQKPLQGLLSRLPGAHGVISEKAPLPPYDYRCPLMSLPFALRLKSSDLPACTIPYIHTSPSRTMKWMDLLGDIAGLKVGLAWSGNPQQANDHNRSMPLSALAPLLECDATFISLQKDIRASDKTFLKEAANVRDYAGHIEDFEDTAALIAQLDIVIAVCTSVAHLAGAMGKELWMPLCHGADWRWFLGRTDSPWYPSARLFRQPATGAWGPVVLRLREELLKRIQA